MSLPPEYVALHADATRQLSALPEETALRSEFLAHLAEHPDAMWRQGPAAHFTASMFIFNESFSRALLVLHKKAQLWLQPGGHFESTDRDVAEAAMREAVEETGATGLRPLPGGLRLHRHALNSNFGHCREHLDLRFACVLDESAKLAVSHESHDVRWFPIDQIPQTDPDLPVELALIARQLARL